MSMLKFNWDGGYSLSSYEMAILAGLLTSAGLLLIWVWPRSKEPSIFHLVKDGNSYETLAINFKKRFQCEARKMIDLGFSNSRKAFRMDTLGASLVVVSRDNASFIRNHPNLSFGKVIDEVFGDRVPGLDPFKVEPGLSTIWTDIINGKLTPALRTITGLISEESANALKGKWGEETDWHEITLKPTILEIVAQVTARLFVGEDLCHDPTWLRITVDYTVNLFVAAAILRVFPRFLRPIAPWVVPQLRNIRSMFGKASKKIMPVLEERRKRRKVLAEQGEAAPQYHDVMEWAEQVASGRPYNPINIQLGFSLAAIHTTSDLLVQVIFDLCEKEDLIPDLRNEIIRVIQEDGWQKSALHKLRLMDSVLKESQRLKPVAIVAMNRVTEQKVRLPDGTEIPKNTSIAVSNSHMWSADSSVYPNADEFDGYRFAKMREEPGNENTAQLVTTSVDHLGFGLGQHACPGRFFAAHEVKVVMCHIIMKYDIKFLDDQRRHPRVRRYGINLLSDHQGKVLIRRRKEEISLDQGQFVA
ncbi:hypothetical protein FQN57_004909 [Myotisia sp. PD_48]|nr:hypothetical protein FQN57_004909 [Myotisia sp. PD_48]